MLARWLSGVGFEGPRHTRGREAFGLERWRCCAEIWSGEEGVCAGWASEEVGARAGEGRRRVVGVAPKREERRRAQGRRASLQAEGESRRAGG